MSISEARERLGKDAVVGVSVHSIEEALRKEEEGASYVTFGAVYPTQTKPADHPIQGLDLLKSLVVKLSIPVVAIGGIHLNRLEELYQTGAQAFSVISDVCHHPSPAHRACELVERWNQIQKCHSTLS